MFMFWLQGLEQLSNGGGGGVHWNAARTVACGQLFFCFVLPFWLARPAVDPLFYGSPRVGTPPPHFRKAPFCSGSDTSPASSLRYFRLQCLAPFNFGSELKMLPWDLEVHQESHPRPPSAHSSPFITRRPPLNFSTLWSPGTFASILPGFG